MTDKIKIACGAAAAGIAVIVAVLAVTFWGPSGILTAIPKPDGSKPYMLIEAKDGSWPRSVSSLLTDGLYALLQRGTPRNAILSAASAAQEAGVLVETDEESGAEVYCSLRFDGGDLSALKDGKLPTVLAKVFKNGEIRIDERDKSIRTIHAEDMAAPVYYAIYKKYALMAASPEALGKMLAAAKDSKLSLGKKKWSQERDWPAHIELCDGGAMTANAEHKFPITIEAAWRALEKKSAADPAGEARWALVNLDKPVELYLNSSLKARKWDTQNCIIPEPLLLSMGIDIPKMDGSPKDWPFPLSSLGKTAEGLEMSDEKIREILSGQTVFSLGGQNRILWFTLPGFLVEFSGRPELMGELIDSFWKNLFFGAEPKPIDGFTKGGTTNVPFSVVGAGRDGIAVLGLTTPASIRGNNRLGKFLKDDEEVVGWMLADLPRIGGALSEMTKMSSFLGDEGAEDEGEGDGGEEETLPSAKDGSVEADPIQPEMGLTPFDQGVTDSFGQVLKGMGRVLVVWETPLTGRINWYNTKK